MKVGEYFTLEEFTISQEAARWGMKNDPPPKAIEAIKLLCKLILDPLRNTVGTPIIIISGYRSKRVNGFVGGSVSSQHMKGEAADIIIPGKTVELIIALIEHLDLPYDQMIDEYNRWVHISYRNNPRGERLIARRTKDGTEYKPF